jgi:sec-independent protein translocase protein TatA
MSFGNLGFMEIMLILIAVLLLFGAKRLPEIGRSFGKSINEFKRGLTDVNKSIREESPPERIAPSESVAADQEESRPEPKRLIS